MLHLRRGTAALTTALLGLALTSAPVHAANEQDDKADTGDYRMQLVLDSSGSMKERAEGGTKIKAAKQALDTVIDNLPGEAQVGMRVYGAEINSGKGACTDSQQVVEPGTDNRDALHKAIDDYKPLGETPIGYALQEAAKDLGSEGKRTIVLVSDGESTCKPDPCKVARKLSKNGIDLRIDVVGLSVDPKTRKQLTCIAKAGNGTYYDADDAESLTRSIDKVSARAFRPFDLTGEPVHGAKDPANAPTLDPGTQYLDKLPAGRESRYYRFERSDPDSVLHVGTTARTASDSIGNGVLMRLTAEDSGLSCGSGSSFANSVGADRPLLAGSVSTTNGASADDPECTNADYFILEVQPSTTDTPNGPFEIIAYEEPPLSEAAKDELPPAAEVPDWSQLAPDSAEDGIVPGTSLANAPVLDDGTYALDIQTGETQVFAVPLDWGRRLQVQIDAKLPDAALEHSGIYAGFAPEIYTAMRSKASVDMSGGEPSGWTTAPFANMEDEDDNSWRTGAMTPTVRYLNRTSPNSDIAGSALPGYRYVEVNLNLMKEGVTIPYELTVERFGKAGDGAPEYQESEGLGVPAADSTYTSLGEAPDDGGSGNTDSTDSEENASDSEDTTSGDEGAASDEDTDLASNSESGSDDFPMLVLLLGGAGVIVLAGGITAVALARRPR